MTTTTEPQNLRHHGGYEVWYLTWNHPGTGQGYWLRHVIESGHAELWFARFDPRAPERTFGVHRRFAATPTGRDGGEALPFRLAFGGAELAHDHATGALAAAGHEVRWDLSWTPAPRGLRHYPDVMYARGGLGTTTVESPNPRVRVTGELVVDGERLAMDGAILGQTHVWGTKHALTWTWGRCAELAGARAAVLELTGGRLQRGGVTLPVLATLALDLDGEPIHLNQVRHLAGNRARWELGRVEVHARGAAVRVDCELTCRPDQMIEAPYVDPDGTQLWCANTEIGDARVTVSRRTWRGWRVDRTLVGAGTAHFEVGRRERDPRVPATHVLVV